MKCGPQPCEGSVTIEWSRAQAGGGLPGWRFAIRGEDGELITTVTELVIYAAATDLTWAEMVMFTGRDGRPLLSGGPVPDRDSEDEEILTGTFRFLVADMRVAEPQS